MTMSPIYVCEGREAPFETRVLCLLLLRLLFFLSLISLLLFRLSSVFSQKKSERKFCTLYFWQLCLSIPITAADPFRGVQTYRQFVVYSFWCCGHGHVICISFISRTQLINDTATIFGEYRVCVWVWVRALIRCRYYRDGLQSFNRITRDIEGGSLWAQVSSYCVCVCVIL